MLKLLATLSELSLNPQGERHINDDAILSARFKGFTVASCAPDLTLPARCLPLTTDLAHWSEIT